MNKIQEFLSSRLAGYRRLIVAALVGVALVATGCQAVAQTYSETADLDEDLGIYRMSLTEVGDEETLDLGPFAGIQFGCISDCTVVRVTLSQVNSPIDAHVVRCHNIICSSYTEVGPLTTYSPSGGEVVNIEEGAYVKVDDGCVLPGRIRLRARTTTPGTTDFVEAQMTHVCGIPD